MPQKGWIVMKNSIKSLNSFSHILRGCLSIFMLFSGSAIASQYYDQAIDIQEFISLSAKTNGHLTDFKSSFTNYNTVAARIAKLHKIDSVETRLREAVEVADDLDDISIQITGQIDGLTRSLDNLVSKFNHDAKLIKDDSFKVKHQRLLMKALMNQQTDINNMNKHIDDDTFEHISKSSQLLASHKTIIDSPNFAGTPTSISDIAGYIQDRIRDLQIMKLSLRITRDMRKHLHGIVQKREYQQLLNNTVHKISFSSSDATDMLKSAADALLMDDTEMLESKKVKRNGNPFLPSSN